MNELNHALRIAAEEGDQARVKTLLAHPGCSALSADPHGWTALMAAAFFAQTPCLELLLPVSNVLAENSLKETAFMFASESRNLFCIELLLPLSDVLARNIRGETALMFAVESKSIPCIKRLLTVSDLSARNESGQTASEYARVWGQPLIADLVDAYALSMHELKLLHLSTSFGSSRKPTVPRLLSRDTDLLLDFKTL